MGWVNPDHFSRDPQQGPDGESRPAPEVKSDGNLIPETDQLTRPLDNSAVQGRAREGIALGHRRRREGIEHGGILKIPEWAPSMFIRLRSGEISYEILKQ
jgi:hypothetical protein